MSGVDEFLSKISGSLQDQYDYINSIEVSNFISDVNRERIERIIKVSLPFITMCERAKRPVAVILGTTHVVTSLFSLQKACNQKNEKIKTEALYQTAFTTVTAACSIFVPPLGMLMTTGNELLNLSQKLTKALKKENYNKALLISAKITSHALSLGLLFTNASQIMIASLSLQILLGLIQSSDDIKDDKYLEAAGNLIMTAIQGYQLKIEVEVYQLQRAIDQHVAEAEKEIKRILGVPENEDISAKKKPVKNITEEKALTEKKILQKAEEYFKNKEVSERKAPDYDISLLVGRSPSDKEIIDALLKHYQGFCVGELHHEESSQAFLINNMDYLKSKNVKVLFAEGWAYTDQKIMDQYFKVKHLRELKSSDRKKVQKLLDFSTYDLKNKLGSPYTAIALLEKTKQSGIRLVGIDYKHEGKSFVANERMKKMNFVAAQVMETTRAKMKPEEKFVAIMGGAHLLKWTEGGVSVQGVADLTKTPSVWFIDYPKKIRKNEDTCGYFKVIPELPKLNFVIREVIA